MDAGLNQALSLNRMPVAVARDYLNLDILSEGVDTKVVAEGIHRKIHSFDPHILIAVDDETNDLVARHYVKRSGPKIIYTALMHDPQRYGYTAESGVWGIREQVPVHGISKLFEQLHPGQALRIAAIGVDDLTGTAEMDQLLNHDWGRHRITSHALVAHFEAWKEFVRALPSDIDVLLVLTIDKIPAGPRTQGMAPEADVSAWTEANSSAWPIGIRASYVRMGGGFAISAPPTELGAMAMELALKRLASSDFVPASSSQTTESYDISARRSALARRGIVIPEIYLESARGAGKLYR